MRVLHVDGVSTWVRPVMTDVRAVRFNKPPFGKRGYDEQQVDAVLEKIAVAIADLRGQ